MDPLCGVAAFVLFALWRLSVQRGFPTAVPVMFTFHWIQICVGIYYQALTGREVDGSSQYETAPMAYLGLVYLIVLFAGFALGARGLTSSSHEVWAPVRSPPGARRRALRWYFVWLPVGLGITGLAWSVPGLTQQVLALGLLRFVFFTLAAQHLVARGDWRTLGLLGALEVAAGFTGFFSEFWRPVLLALVVLVDRYRQGSQRAGRVALTTFFLLVALSLLWTGIKRDVRAEIHAGETRLDRLERVVDKSVDWLESRALAETFDRLVSRAWELEYPARALARVPALLPHEDGKLLRRAVYHVLVPRVIDPDKPRLISDSELVRKYAGVWVAGDEAGASIGLSYVAESYIDFGLPWMFVPIFGLGLLFGGLISALSARIPDPWIRSAVVTVLVCVSMNKFEVPWTKVLGGGLTAIIVVGAVVLAAERFRARRSRPAARAPRPPVGRRPARPPRRG